MTNFRSNENRFTIVVISVAALVLRLAFLGHKSLWLDEAATYSLCRLPWQEFKQAWWAHEANMTAYYALQRVWLHFGSSEWMLRFPSAILGALSIPAIYALGRRILNADAALIAAVLLAVNPAHLEYSQEARSYPMAILFVQLAALFFVRASESKSARDWAAFVLFAAIAVYAHFFAVLVFAAFFVSLLAQERPRWAHAIVAFTVLGLLISPAIFFVLFRGETMDLYWLPPVGLSSFWKLAQFYVGSGVKIVVAFILFCVALWGLRRESRWTQVFLLSWLALPVLLTFFASLHRNIFSYKYLLVSLPPLLLLCAWGSLQFPCSARWALLAVLVVASSLTDVASYRKPREDWRALNQYVAANYQSGDAIAFYPPYARNPFDYYHQRTGPASLAIAAPNVVGGDLTEDVYDIAHPERMVEDLHNPRLWIVLYGNRPESAQMFNALPAGYTQKTTQNFSGIELRLYQR